MLLDVCVGGWVELCGRGIERNKERPQRRAPEVLLRAASGFFPPLLCGSGHSPLKWFCQLMALASSETFPCSLKGRENASLLVDGSSGAMAFICTALLLHQNNEKVAKAESDCQSASAVRDSGWQDGDSIYLVRNNAKLSQNHCRHLARDRCHCEEIIVPGLLFHWTYNTCDTF